MQALGLIETRGLLAAIECADVMLKTAQVELVGRTFVGGGLVTIAVTGDVGAVKAAVEAGVTSVERIGHLLLISQHVIPRPHNDIESIVVVSANPVEEQTISVPQQEKNLPNKDTATDTHAEQITLTQLNKEGFDAFVLKVGLEKSLNYLKSLSVVKLRNLAREYKELGIAGRAISKANKALLIQQLKGCYEMEIEK